MTAVSGRQTITHHSILRQCLGDQFNNPDVSDLTLQVDKDTYHVHKLILAAQSSVFHSMLTGNNWIESKEKSIQLDEHPDCVKVFSHFLKYLYVGEVTLTCDNVCSLHMLSDKYDIGFLKDACLEFITDVLKGVHGDLLKSAMMWLQYIEKYLPDLVEKCFEVIRNHFYALERCDINLANLTVAHMKTLLDPRYGNEIVVENEYLLLTVILEWNALKSDNSPTLLDSDILDEILPLIRFGNMTPAHLNRLVNKCSKPHIKDMIFDALNCQYEMLDMASSHRIKGKKVTCPCDKKRDDHMCNHMNPRMYFYPPYSGYRGMDIDDDREACYSDFVNCQPIDINNLTSYVERVVPDKTPGNPVESVSNSWRVYFRCALKKKKDVEIVGEEFMIRPKRCHLGREFTLVITVLRGIADKRDHHMYTIKLKGFVTKNDTKDEMDQFFLFSPRRLEGEWLSEDSCDPDHYEYMVRVAIHLHKSKQD